jgi:protein phosphatase
MRTDVGRVRERNEDAAYVDPAGRFVIVADGMGGNKAGDVASAMAVDVVRTLLEASNLELAALAPKRTMRKRIRLLLERAVRLANEAVYERGRRDADKADMGTTLEVVVFAGGEAFVAHVGDSRTYLVRGGETTLTTSDHSVAEVMRRAGSLSDADAKTSPMRSVLANAIGITKLVVVDQAHLELRPGDRVLICSDGLYDYFTDREIGTHLADGTQEEALAALVLQARVRGGHDNITGVVVEVLDAEAAIVDPVEDVVTTPIALPVEQRRLAPLSDFSDDAMSSIVERVFHEASGPH